MAWKFGFFSKKGVLLDDRLKKFHITDDEVIKTLHEENMDGFEKV